MRTFLIIGCLFAGVFAGPSSTAQTCTGTCTSDFKQVVSINATEAGVEFMLAGPGFTGCTEGNSFSIPASDPNYAVMTAAISLAHEARFYVSVRYNTNEGVASCQMPVHRRIEIFPTDPGT